MASNPQHKKSSIGIGSLMLYLTVFSIVGLILFKYYNNNYSDYTSVPKDMQVNYIPSDFNYEMDDETTMAILANPHRYRREFNDLVYNFNLSLLHHVANRMDLPDSLKVRLEDEYQEHHHYLKQLYFNDFIAIRDTSANMYETWYENNATSAIETMNEVASKYTCFLVNHVIMTQLKAHGGTLSVKGKKVDTPCAIALSEGLAPMITRLKEKAAIDDFSASKGLMEEKIEKVIAELATMEIRDKKALNKQLQSKVFGYTVSTSDIEVSAISILKVGFKLDEYFDMKLSDRNKMVTITLPKPSVLSHEVYPKIDKLDIGWLREVKSVDLNKNFNMLRSEFRRDALNSDVLKKAEDQAKELMSMMFLPVVKNFNKKYTLRVLFKNTKSSFIEEEYVQKKPAPESNTKQSNQKEEALVPYEN